MASTRPVVQQNHREEAAPVAGGGGKQKKMAAEGRNRRALGDIGNLVTARGGIDAVKPLPQVSRPITRSFCAQLLANAQAAAAENNKKQMAIPGDGVLAGIGGKQAALPLPPKAAQKKKVVVESKPEDVIEISSSETEQVKKERPNRKKAIEASSSMKNGQTLTSTLTARSKAACGINKKPKEQIVDIDAADATNELAAVEYVEDMYKFYKEAETESQVSDYMDSQPEINQKMRAILVDWLIEVQHKFELSPETLYLTVNIVDRYLATKMVARRELQLLGISAMLLASKYEEIWAPEVNDFVCISDRAYTNQQVLAMEKKVLGRLEWSLTVPTPYVFLVRFIKASLPNEPDVNNMTYFLAELGMMNYATVMYLPSMVAASAVYAARRTLNKTPVWNDTLKLHTGFSEAQLMDCAKLLVGLHSAAAENKLRVIYRKYSNPERGAVAFLPPAKSLLPAANN
ncbi:G2/mitotic-specific cyclin S13-7 isoform X2 [Daucus carota subsp. sativus]|uniref:G2/mitotic-specific cyclin S13-7 isoform X2 n=1 Tax=Daucus carota subsp. sativus TaxID=79200 RepID=UPI0007F0392F|nr:PREDICTED: G2/mitotic-specific cyclin S13-7-like isoform X2 [Daucus carota subsp. sativus]